VEPGAELTPSHFGLDVHDEGRSGALVDDLEDFERERILKALREAGWVKTAAARILKMTRTSLNSKMERLGIPFQNPDNPRLK
jgi:transcriptional regulator with GAF, ATPase, and Fis domain